MGSGGKKSSGSISILWSNNKISKSIWNIFLCSVSVAVEEQDDIIDVAEDAAEDLVAASFLTVSDSQDHLLTTDTEEVNNTSDLRNNISDPPNPPVVVASEEQHQKSPRSIYLHGCLTKQVPPISR